MIPRMPASLEGAANRSRGRDPGMPARTVSPCDSATWQTMARLVRQAARRRARARGRADAGAPVRDPDAGPAGRRGREGRAPRARRVGPGVDAGDARSPGPQGRRDLPAQQLQQAQHRHRPEVAGGPRAVPRARAALRRDRRELQARDDGPHGPRLRRDRGASTRAIYVSISGFGNTVETPYRDWPAYASIVEAMSGIYDYRHPDEPPVTIPVGALGDISSALFGVIGILAALRHREHTGVGQYVDIAMFDAMIAMTDIVTNFWSLGVRPGARQGARGDLRGLPRVRRLRRRADRARAPVLQARRRGRTSGVEGRPALRDARVGVRTSRR